MSLTRVTPISLKVVLVQCYALWTMLKVICRTLWSLVLISVMKKPSEYLLSLLKETLGTGPAEMTTSVSVVMTDCTLVNQRLCRSSESAKGQGVWCQQDGCVFNTIFCPFCSIPNRCLGVQVKAADSSNVQFLSKILFFVDQVDVTEDESSKETALEHKKSPDITNRDADKSDVFKSIEKFAYSPTQQQDSGGWRTRKIKVETT